MVSKIRLSDAIRGALGGEDETALAWVEEAERLEQAEQALTEQVANLLRRERALREAMKR